MGTDPTSGPLRSYRLCRCSRQCDSMPCNKLSAADAHYYQLIVRNLAIADLSILLISSPFAIVKEQDPYHWPLGEFLCRCVRLSLVGFVFWRVALVDHSYRCWSSPWSQSHSPRSPSEARFHRVQVIAFDGRLCLDSVVSDHFGATIRGHGFLRLQARFQHNWLHSEMAEWRRWRWAATSLLHEFDRFLLCPATK